MQKFNYSVCSLFLILMSLSCADEPLPFETFDEYEKGAFARLLSTDDGDLFLTHPDNSSFTFDVEYYSEHNGTEVESHEWFVRHRNNVDGSISDPVLIGSNPSSSFGTDPKSGLPTSSFTFTLNDALSVMEKSIDDLNRTDELIFDGFVVMKDGRRFGPDNTDASIQGGAGFDGIFRFIKPLLCRSELAGSYTAVATVTDLGASTPWIDCLGNTWEGPLRIVRVEGFEGAVYRMYTTNNGVEFLDMSFGMYFACYETDDQDEMPNGELAILDDCRKLRFIGTSQWGEVYSFMEISTEGAVLNLKWSNDYGESGTVAITRDDGLSWPAFKI